MLLHLRADAEWGSPHSVRSPPSLYPVLTVNLPPSVAHDPPALNTPSSPNK